MALNSKYYLLILTLLGSLLRCLYGYFYNPWDHAIDQIVWEAVLDQDHIRYDQLIHYPHEGGTILISLLSHFFKLFTDFNSLTISAFICDFAIRLIQLFIIKKVFDNKTAYLFGIWAVFATPIMIPWGVVNYGLHYLSSLFPFILMYIIWLNKNTRIEYIKNGLFLGLTCWFSYNNVVLIVVYFLFHMFKKEKPLKWVYSFLSLAAVLLVHLVVRVKGDAGFHLEQLDVGSIRGAEFVLNDIDTWKRLYQVWFNPLPDSVIAIQNTTYYAPIIKYILICTFVLGFFGCINVFLKRAYSRRGALNLITILLFISLYAISPFYYDSPNLGNYVAYRHLSYIFPLIALFVLVGLSSYKFKKTLPILFILIGVYSSSMLFTTEKNENNSRTDKAVGWLLAKKFGDDSKRLYKIIESSDRDKKFLIEGVGWGLSTALFMNVDSHNLKEIDDKVYLLLGLVDDYPDSCRDDIMNGIKFSFGKKVTPRLDKSILFVFLNEYNSKLKQN